MRRIAFLFVICWCVVAVGLAHGKVYVAGPKTYRDRFQELEPGDTLALEAGVYRRGLPIHEMHGRPEHPITISGPLGEQSATFYGRSGHNVVSIVDSSYVKVSDLEIDGRGKMVDGVKAEGHAHYAHHITLERLRIQNLGHNQQIVGISAMCPTWNWVVRDNVIIGAGTGMYLGRPNGRAPFVGGLIEHNLVKDTIGYNIQIKHQVGRPDIEGFPNEPQTTIIRHNVFSKAHGASSGEMARPNLLVGHWPPTGPGSHDLYAIYGNLFYQNPSERLFQGEGNLAFYSNLLVNRAGDALAILPHNGHPRRIWIFQNTIVARDRGILFKSTPETQVQKIQGNAIFAAHPIKGGKARENLRASKEEAADYLRKPFAQPRQLNLYPQAGKLRQRLKATAHLMVRFPEASRDFDGRLRSGMYQGGYVGDDEGPRWALGLSPKPWVQGDKQGELP